ncbi:hypothetical protein RchiOBHm_Chr6g0288921 [Rosa chinensis]|uniref:Uncharacterized protein n=1 Tax=Rosa chinensis TaxID=74649 RepID=A0A2P6PVH1_ROSCH|nr:hypothetical protein RchiOBHm_Chr6g0288921 [Rosa chinensis]
MPSSSLLKKKKPVIRRLELERSSSEMASQDTVHITAEMEGMAQEVSESNKVSGLSSMEPSDPSSQDLDITPAMQTGQKQTLTYKKRGREEVIVPSPKKFKTILGGKLLTLHAEVLGLAEVEDDVALVTLKKRSGRPLGSKNKGPRSQKKVGLTPLRLIYPSTTTAQEVGPKAKGKGKL